MQILATFWKFRQYFENLGNFSKYMYGFYWALSGKIYDNISPCVSQETQLTRQHSYIPIVHWLTKYVGGINNIVWQLLPFPAVFLINNTFVEGASQVTKWGIIKSFRVALELTKRALTSGIVRVKSLLKHGWVPWVTRCSLGPCQTHLVSSEVEWFKVKEKTTDCITWTCFTNNNRNCQTLYSLDILTLFSGKTTVPNWDS